MEYLARQERFGVARDVEEQTLANSVYGVRERSDGRSRVYDLHAKRCG